MARAVAGNGAVVRGVAKPIGDRVGSTLLAIGADPKAGSGRIVPPVSRFAIVAALLLPLLMTQWPVAAAGPGAGRSTVTFQLRSSSRCAWVSLKQPRTRTLFWASIRSRWRLTKLQREFPARLGRNPVLWFPTLPRSLRLPLKHGGLFVIKKGGLPLPCRSSLRRW